MKLNKVSKIFSLICIGMMMSAFVSAQTVYTDEREKADMSDYSTYDWMLDKQMILSDQILMSDDMVLIYNNETARKNLKDAITTQMKARGFGRDTDSPDMLVDFQILEEATTLRTYRMTNGQDYLGWGPRSMTTKMVPVEAGTVLINFIDAETGNQIWQGFASGAFDEHEIHDISAIDAKVVSIFNDFNFNPVAEE
ncbi:DUF4136 domain-containing protein [Algoriphagus namhaensis]